MACVNGFGRHIYDPSINALDSLRYMSIAEPFNQASIIFAKLCIGGTLLRLGLGRKFTWIIVAAVVVATIGSIVTIVSETAACTPVSKIWNVKQPGKCWPRIVNEAAAYTGTVTDIAADLTFAFSPEFFLRKVQLGARDRQLVRALLLMMLISSVVSIVKLSKLPAIQKTEDPTWDAVGLTISAMAEMQISIIAACLPCLKYLADKILPRSWNPRKGAYNTSTANQPRSGLRSNISRPVNINVDEEIGMAHYHRPGDVAYGRHHARGFSDAGMPTDDSNSEDQAIASDDSGIWGGQIVKKVEYGIQTDEV